MNFKSDPNHDRFVAKNRQLAAANEMEKRDKTLESKGFSHLQRQQEASCFNCKKKSKCVEFRSRSTGGTTGVVSYGGDEKFVCKNYEVMPAQSRGLTPSQIKALMKNAKSGY